MWQEARKQEKKVRSMIVDYRKRAERRREFYEKFKADPTQCLQLHGRSCKIYMDPAVTTAAEESMMPWQGNKETIIDRFDVRAHLDYIPEPATSSESLDADVESNGELNYERYRILVQNEQTNTTEDKFLHQIHLEEQFGSSSTKEPKSTKGSTQPKAAIPYTYADSTADGSYGYTYSKTDPGNEEESEDDVDFDLLVNLNDLITLQKMDLNTAGIKYGMRSADFIKYLSKDVKEKEHQKQLKVQEEEKQQMSGRKARRERRAYKDRQLSRRDGRYSPPSYATALECTVEEPSCSRRSSSGGSRSSESPERITYITSFGAKSDGNSIFGPNLPSAYKTTKSDASRKKNKRSSSRSRSSSPKSRKRKRTRRSSSSDKPKKQKRSSRRRRSSSYSSSTSSSSDTSSARRRRHSRSLSRSPGYKRKGRGRSRSYSKTSSSSSSSKHRSRRSSSLENGSRGSGDKAFTNSSSKGCASTSTRESSSAKLTPQERLKRRMQMQLNKQLKTDKEAEKARMERLEQERLEREETLREMSIRHRKREREKRHEQAVNSSDSNSSRSPSRSLSPR